jgi:hypothetical protein
MDSVRHETAVRVPRLKEVIGALPVLTHETAVLGLDEDGVPVLWNLQDPAVGALLVVGETLGQAQQPLWVMRESLLAGNTPATVRMLWVGEGQGDALTEVISPYTRALEETIKRLGDLVDSRAHGRLRGESVVLYLSDLVRALQVDWDAYYLLEYLVQRGAGQKVWVVAALEAGRADERVWRWVGRFRTHLVGPLRDTAVRRRLGVPESEFWQVRTKGRWVSLVLPR